MTTAPMLEKTKAANQPASAIPIEKRGSSGAGRTWGERTGARCRRPSRAGGGSAGQPVGHGQRAPPVVELPAVRARCSGRRGARTGRSRAARARAVRSSIQTALEVVAVGEGGRRRLGAARARAQADPPTGCDGIAGARYRRAGAETGDRTADGADAERAEAPQRPGHDHVGPPSAPLAWFHEQSPSASASPAARRAGPGRPADAAGAARGQPGRPAAPDGAAPLDGVDPDRRRRRAAVRLAAPHDRRRQEHPVHRVPRPTPRTVRSQSAKYNNDSGTISGELKDQTKFTTTGPIPLPDADQAVLQDEGAGLRVPHARRRAG